MHDILARKTDLRLIATFAASWRASGMRWSQAAKA